MGDSCEEPRTAAGDASALSFEEALEALEGIVGRLEQGDLPLEEALAAFEQGVGLTRRCAAELDQAERRIEILVREGERAVARPYDPGEEAD
ncbi:MAG: exodeoxyribonuclease VII small subunit [Myxococcota bacterium]|nr:exodeoxyribonuclease VII small subunit [Myxococcota bacterium]